MITSFRVAVVCLCASLLFLCHPAFAQDETIDQPASICPWNAHDFSPNFQSPAAQPSEEIESSFQNIAITTSPQYQTECSIAINPKDSLDMIVEEIDGDYFTNGIFVSRDGGSNWHVVQLPLESTTGYAGDPWVTFDANGVAYCCGLEYNSSNKFRLVNYRSIDKGETWTLDMHVMDYGTLDTTADEPVIAVDRNSQSPYLNTLYAITASDGQIPLLGNGPIGIHLQSRRAGSTSLSPQVKTSQIGLAQVPHLTFGLHGEIYIAYIGITDILNLKGALYLNKSTDGGTSWSNDQVIATSGYTDTINGFPKMGFPPASRMGPTPRIVIDTSNGPRRGWLYVSYAMPSSADHKHNLDIFIQHSTDEGKTWSQATRVNDDPVSSLNDQLTPCMAINPDGVLGIVFYDRRDDPNNYMLQTYIAISSDGGVTWKNDRLSSAGTDPMAARRQISIAVADYISIAATRSAFYPIWNDGRTNNGDLNIYTARVPLGTSAVSMERASANAISLSPNPIKDRGVISISGKAKSRAAYLGVYDLFGRRVMSIETNGRSAIPFNTSQLPSGAYQLIDESAAPALKIRFVKVQ